MATPNQREILLSWLQDAYNMEKSIVEVLKSHKEDAKELPEIQSKIEDHLNLTINQAERVKNCITQLGGNVSNIKAEVSKFMGTMTALPTKFSEDKLIKNTIAEYATENFEIALYSALATAARELDENSVVDICEEIIDEEQEMADWLDENLSTLVEMLLSDEEDMEVVEALLEENNEE